jgi:CheY-like chemotaxis protein
VTVLRTVPFLKAVMSSLVFASKKQSGFWDENHILKGYTDCTSLCSTARSLINIMTSQPSPFIVLAEDNSADVLLVREAIREHKIDCVFRCISDGDEVLRFIDAVDSEHERCPDLLLLDLHLPKRDGQEIVRRLRASTRCAYIPIIVLTAHLGPGEKLTTENEVLHFQKSSSVDEYLKIGHLIRQALVS